MAELRFYHLTDSPLERALPRMLELTLERGGRAVVRGGHADRLRFLDTHLWTYQDDGFLPHGTEDDPAPEHQPVLLTTNTAIPNGAKTLFLIDGAAPDFDEIARLDLTAILFDGHDPGAVEAARDHWRSTVAANLKAVYWAQDSGRWIKKAEAGGDADQD
ncbi:MAG: DNA polymerase III subunit chi [Pseudomonadota bacterium]